MATLDTAAVCALLREYAQRAALRGGNPYRAKAYARAAENLAMLAMPLEKAIRDHRLQEVPGIGTAIADIIAKLHKTGTHPTLEVMRKEIPEGVLEMLSVPGLRADKVLKLYNVLGITSLTELEQAARAGKLKGVKGLGPALQAKILQGIEMIRAGQGQRHLHRAAALFETAERHLRSAQPDLKRITPAGDFRRGCELVSDLALVAEAPRVEGGVESIDSGSLLKVHLSDPAHYGIALLLATGSDEHLAQLKSVAAERGMTFDERRSSPWAQHNCRQD